MEPAQDKIPRFHMGLMMPLLDFLSINSCFNAIAALMAPSEWQLACREACFKRNHHIDRCLQFVNFFVISRRVYFVIEEEKSSPSEKQKSLYWRFLQENLWSFNGNFSYREKGNEEIHQNWKLFKCLRDLKVKKESPALFTVLINAFYLTFRWSSSTSRIKNSIENFFCQLAAKSILLLRKGMKLCYTLYRL